MRNVKMILCGMVVATASTSALAATQSSVTFSGRLTPETCSISSTSDGKTVLLPDMAAQLLNAAGLEGGRTPFELSIENCPANITQIAARFEATGTNSDSATGNLLNQSNALGKATNVQVRLYNSDESHLKLGDISNYATVSDGKATMNYYSGYYATGAATAGAVEAKVNYTLVYN